MRCVFDVEMRFPSARVSFRFVIKLEGLLKFQTGATQAEHFDPGGDLGNCFPPPLLLGRGVYRRHPEISLQTSAEAAHTRSDIRRY